MDKKSLGDESPNAENSKKSNDLINHKSSDAIIWQDEGDDDDDARVELGVVGQIWTKRHINAPAFMATMKNVWQPSHGLDISSIGENKFMFQFYHWRDKKRVMEDQPWHFDKHAIVLSDIEGNLKPSDMELFELPLWVRVYNLPFKGRLNHQNFEAIGNKIGTFVKIDCSGSLGIDKSLRMRVLIDVRKALIQKVKVKMRGGEEGFFEVKYEKPPLFCFFCGKIGHGVKDCDDCKDMEEPPVQYGGWLKASPWKKSLVEEKVRITNAKVQCARSLFITQPKKKTSPCAPQNLSEVVNRLDRWGIGNHERSLHEGTTLLTSDQVREDGGHGQKDSSTREHEIIGEVGNTYPAAEVIPVTGEQDLPPLISRLAAESVHPQMEHIVKKKGWKRVPQSREEGEIKGAKLGGSRRKKMERETDQDDPMLVDGSEMNKRRALSLGNAQVNNEEILSDNVAGPTHRALGDS